jgi:hypothetical protein
MSTLLELIQGEGRADTVVRALVLALLLGVSAALVWTTVSGRARPDAPVQTSEAAGPRAEAPLYTALH